MRDDAARAAALDAAFAAIKAIAGEQEARQWAKTLGAEQAVRDYECRQQIALAVRLLNEGERRADVRDRLLLMGLSRPTAYRRIDEALSQRGRHRETFAGNADGIATSARPSPP